MFNLKKIRQLKNTIEEKEADITELQGTIDANEIQKKEAEREAKHQEQTITSLKLDLDNANIDLKTKDDKLSQANKKIEKQGETITELSRKLGGKTRGNQEMVDRVKRLEKELSQEKQDRLKEKHEMLLTINDLNTELTEIKKKPGVPSMNKLEQYELNIKPKNRKEAK